MCEENIDLAKSFTNFIDNLSIDSKVSVNDWYEEVGIPIHQRSDFIISALFKQVNERGLLNKIFI